jgi:hypothetical protein
VSQRSPFNDRYKVESKGKTRKSASAAKPKRAVADVGTPAKRKTGRSSAWSRAKAASAAQQKSSGKQAPRELPPSPRMRQLRKYWWIAWIGALLVALAILGLQQLGQQAASTAGAAATASGETTAAIAAARAAAQAKWTNIVPIGWALWLAGMGFAFYLEFVPIKRERQAMLDAAASGHGKRDKADKPEKPSKGGKAPVIDAPHENEEADGEDA